MKQHRIHLSNQNITMNQIPTLAAFWHGLGSRGYRGRSRSLAFLQPQTWGLIFHRIHNTERGLAHMVFMVPFFPPPSLLFFIPGI